MEPPECGPHDKPCYFLELPAELRNRIYERVLIIHENPHEAVQINHKIWLHESDPDPSILSILATCRQVYSEAAGMFESLNHLYVQHDMLSRLQGRFTVSLPRIVRRGFLEMLSPKRLAGIERMTISIHKKTHVVLELLSIACKRIAKSGLPRLRTLNFNLYCRDHLEESMRSLKRERHLLLRHFSKLPVLQQVCITLITDSVDVHPLAAPDALDDFAEMFSADWTRRTQSEKVLQFETDSVEDAQKRYAEIIAADG